MRLPTRACVWCAPGERNERAQRARERERAYASNKIDLLLCSCSFLVAHANTITMSDR